MSDHALYQARSRSRRRAIQALYQWQLAGHEPELILAQFAETQDQSLIDVGYFEDLVRGTTHAIEVIDATLAPFLDRPLSSVDPLERAIVRLGCYELLQRPDIPYRVVLNEAIELAKAFGGEGGHGYVNGVLDHVARTQRELEYRKS